MPDRVELTTQDQVCLVGDIYRTGQPPSAHLLLLHMMPADRTSWAGFAGAATRCGFNSLAIDLRGHGESTQRGNVTLDYHTFSDEEHQQSINDVEAGLQFVASQAHGAIPTFILGASIGANLALQATVNHPEIPGAVLLSPGIDYHGIHAQQLITNLAPTQELFLVASNDDDYSFETIRLLNSLRDDRTLARQITDAGHGTTMLDRQPELINDIIEWMSELIHSIQNTNVK